MSNDAKRKIDEYMVDSPVLGLSTKRHTSLNDSISHSDKKYCADQEGPIQATFDGLGIQVSGEGSFYAGRDVLVGASSCSSCLADLRCTDPGTDKMRIEASKGGLLEEAYQWVIENPTFLFWRDGPEQHLLWIRGNPGKGKTMLMCGIIDKLRTHSWNSNMAFFFCQAADPRLNNATAVLRGLLYILICQQKHLIRYLQQKYDHAGKELFEDENAWFALSEIFISVLNDPSLGNVCFLVDALDECETGRDRLLDLVTRTSGFGHVRWLVSSRNLPLIQEKLSGFPRKIELSLEAHQDSIGNAVRNYIRHKVEHLARLKKYTPEIHDAVEQYLTENAKNTFLWVALVCQELAQVQAWGARAKIKTFPPGLESLYRRMMDHVRVSQDAQLCKQILSVMTLVYRPISLAELHHTVDLPTDFPQNEELLGELVHFCGCFLTVRDRTVYFVHQSAKDFLQNETAKEIYQHGIFHEHRSIYLRSIGMISSTLKQDLYMTDEPGLRVDQVKRPDPDPLASLRYACVHWIDHLCGAMSQESMVSELLSGKEIIHFFKTHYLHWLEALSLLRCTSDGVQSLAKLFALSQKETASVMIIHDAFRFIRYHKTCIETYPLQIYSSALVFSPTQSIVRKAYLHEEPDWLIMRPIMESHWSPCLQTLEGHSMSVTSIAYANNGTLLASGSKDGTIRVWETTTGAITQILGEDNHSWAGPVTFSPNGQLLASVSRSPDNINIWDVARGRCIQTLRGDHGPVLSLSFMPDGHSLISGSQEATIDIWDLSTGSVKQSFKVPRNQNGWNDIIAFSPSGRMLAAAVHGHAIRIYSIPAGTRIQTFGSPLLAVTSMAFSPDDCVLATGLHDSSIQLWDTATGVLDYTFRGHVDSVNSVAFSNNGHMVASGSKDHRIKIWNVITRACIQTFGDHCAPVNCIVFSPDGHSLATGSEDHAIKIWVTDSSTESHTYRDHSALITMITFSPQGRLIASGSDDHSTKVWDAATGLCLHTLTGHEASIKALTFSPHDSHTLVSGSYDSTIRIWDVTTGEHIRTLQGHDEPINSLVFLALSTLASSSDDGTIRIWDMNDGACFRTLKYQDGPVRTIAFSPDRRLLAWASDCAIKLQDTYADMDTQCLVFEGHSDIIKSISISSGKNDRHLLASSSYDETIKIWNTLTGICIQNLAMGKHIDIVEFEFGHSLRTDIGTIDLSHLDLELDHSRSPDTSDSSSACVPTGLSIPCIRGHGITEGMWITWGNRKILWLPFEYRPGWSGISGNMIAIGSRTGRFLIFQLDAVSLS